jgi:hypothetical protein
MTLEQQRDILDHTYKLLTDFNHGIPPKGSVAPWWETSKEGTILLLEKGIEYGQYRSSFVPKHSVEIALTDHSNMSHE